ncbi:hypothetical protein TL16_g10178 [Triparma laevis f. inornata]|uniref:Uncharacterized protein n=1 Tax=Triparma laevis f. inornata TaxID=1714386 RepID=A0A9W7BAY5_9STRA|nr:hypothetical protein TL16_g10178 [Triparma laevis f. inornata]
MSARDNMFDPDGSTKASIDGIKDAKQKERHYFAYHSSFNVNDFQGIYHTHKIKHKFPIPGTALKKEQERIKFMEKRGGILNEEVKKITKKHDKLAKVKERHIRLASNLEFQSRVGDMIRRVGGVLESAQETVQGSPPKVNPALAANGGKEMSEEEKAMKEKKTKAALEAAGAGSEGDDDSLATEVTNGVESRSLRTNETGFEPKYVPTFWRLVHAGKCNHVANYLSTGFPHIDGREPKFGNTVLISAIRKGDDKEKVLQKCAEMEERAARRNEQEKATVAILRLLLSHGAAPNCRDGSGATALHDAARRGPIQAVKMLLQFGADSLMRNDSNQTAERCAIQQKQTEAEKLLKNWQQLLDPHNKAEFLSEWKSFLDDVDIPIVIPSASAKRVLDDLMIQEHQDTLSRWKRVGMPVVDEIVSGPLTVPLEAKALIDPEKQKALEGKKGRALKIKAKNEDYARVQKMLNEGKAQKEADSRLSVRERKVKRAKELVAEKESNVAQTKRLPKESNTLEVPLDYYLQGRVGGGFIERKADKKKLSKDELVGVGAKRKKIEEEKRRIYRMTVGKKRPDGVFDNFGVGRAYDQSPTIVDERHRAAALQVKDDGRNLKSMTRPSTSSIIGVPLKREKVRGWDEERSNEERSDNYYVNLTCCYLLQTAEEVDLERRRRADVDKRIILRQRMSQREASQQNSAIETFQASDPSSKLRQEAARRRDPSISGALRKQFCEDEILPAIPPNPDVKHAKALMEAGHDFDDLVDLMSLPSAQYEAMMKELEEQSLEQKEDISLEMKERGLIKFHSSTHMAKAKAANSRLSRIHKVIPEEPWSAIINADYEDQMG